MTNKPMLRVERELRSAIEQSLLAMKRIYQAGYDSITAAGGACDQPGVMFENDPTVTELRAFLDKPVDDPNLGIEMMRGAGSGLLIQDHGSGWQAVTFNRGVRVSSFPLKGGYKEAVAALDAAQQQGEPVTFDDWFRREVGDPNEVNPKGVESRDVYVARKAWDFKQPTQLKIGAGVTVENIGFRSEEGRKPFLVFDGNGCLTQVNLIDFSLVSKRQAHTIADLESIGVRVEQPAPVAVVMPDNLISHRESWLQAMERLVALEAEATPPTHDSNEPAYWAHELKAMRDMYADFDRLNEVKP